jgi:hypothetical protein
MRSLLCCLTSASVLLHLVLGCCAHHLHAEESHGEHSAAACQHEEHEHEAPANRHSPECGESECVFAAAVKEIQPVSAPAIILWLPVEASDLPAERLSYQRQLSRHDPPPLPLRVHLLLGVLLN